MPILLSATGLFGVVGVEGLLIISFNRDERDGAELLAFVILDCDDNWLLP